MELFDVIKSRRSYRGMYQQKPVSREDLRLIMEAALAAPSGCNKQTTSVIAVDDPELMKQLGDMLGKPNLPRRLPPCASSARRRSLTKTVPSSCRTIPQQSKTLCWPFRGLVWKAAGWRAM